MKKHFKVLIALVVVAVLSLAVSLTALAESTPEYTGSLTTATQMLAPAKAASGADKSVALADLGSYLAENPVDPATEGYDDFIAEYCTEAVACGTALLDGFDAAEGTARRGVALNKAKAFNKKAALLHEVEAYGELSERLEKAIATHEEDKYDALVEISYGMDLSEYDLPVNLRADFDSATVNFATKQVLPSDSKKAFVGVESKADGTNKYLTVRHDGEVAGHCYVGLNVGNAPKGFVLEFDITTFGALPENASKFENGSILPDGATSRIYPVFFSFSGDGDIRDLNNSAVYLEDAIVPGEWLHVAFAFDPVEWTFTLYVENEVVATFSSIASGYKYIPNLIRMGSSNKSGEFSIDNFVIYQGTQIHDKDYLDNMSDDDAFVFYCNYLANENNETKARKYAYNGATELLSNYYKNGEYFTEDEEIRACVDSYLSFDYEAIYNAYVRENLDTYKTLADALLALDAVRSPSNISNRKTSLESVKSFVSSVTDEYSVVDIYTDPENENDEYRYYTRLVAAASANIDADDRIIIFNRAMNRFATATTIFAMQRHYETANTIVAEGLDVAVLSGPHAENYPEFAAHYETYVAAAAYLDAATKDYNAETIIGCMNLISEYDTEAEWQANYAYVEEYVLIVRRLLQENNYNPNYIGLADALEFYEIVNEYFYHQLQLKHAGVLREMLDKYISTDSYAERMGICAYIQSYLSNNDIDEDREVIAPLLVEYNTYNDEVQGQEEVYGQILIQNSYYFMNLVNDISTRSGYNELKPLIDEAYVLYFAIDASVEGAEEAIALFDATYAEMKEIENGSELFKTAVAVLGAAETESGRYERLVNACYYIAFASDDIEGVKEARAAYTEAYNAYSAKVNSANAELVSASVAVGSVRANAGPNAMVAIILKKVFG